MFCNVDLAMDDTGAFDGFAIDVAFLKQHNECECGVELVDVYYFVPKGLRIVVAVVSMLRGRG